MIHTIFGFCVWALISLADLLGTTYEAINVWIFVILWPAFTLALMAAIVWQHNRIRKLHRQMNERQLTRPG